MTEQTFPMPHVWTQGDGRGDKEMGPVVTVRLSGKWDPATADLVLLAIRWAATRAAINQADPLYLQHWIANNPMPACLGLEREE